jgi:hypothetical protein
MNTIRYLGQAGSDLVEDTTAMTGNWFAIQILEEAAFSVLTDASMDVTGTLSSVTFPAGVIIFGAFTAFTLSSGAVLAYRVKPE